MTRINFILPIAALFAFAFFLVPSAHVAAVTSDAASVADRIQAASTQKRQGAPGSPRPHISERVWEKLVGMRGEDAAKTIRTDNPMLHVHIVPEGSMVTMDYRVDRVRVFVDKEGKVTRTPKIG